MRLLWIVGILAWACCFALGFNYKYGDSITTTIILFVALLGIMGTDIFLLNRYVSPDSGVNRKNAGTKEVACLFVYIIMVILTIGSVAHYIHVESNIKSTARQDAKKHINEIRRVYNDEDTVGNYLYYVEEYAKLYQDNLENDKGYSNKPMKIEAAVTVFNQRMLGNDGSLYENTKSSIINSLNECEKHVDNWIPWNINEYLSSLDKEYILTLDSIDNHVEKLVELSQNVLSETFGENYDESYKYNPNFYESKEIAPKLKGTTTYSLLSIVVIILIQILIVVPYIKEKDWSRTGPRKHKANPGGFMVYDGKVNKTTEKEEREDYI